MRRRDFIGLCGSLAGWPIAASAQYQSGRTQRIALLVNGTAGDPEVVARLAAFQRGLERLGWFDGKNVNFDARFSEGAAERARGFVKELVALQPDVILSDTTLITAMFRRESGTIPIVFVEVSDPIGAGFIASLAQPGGNTTGVALYEEGIAGKWLDLLKEARPEIKRVAVMGNPKNIIFNYFLRNAQSAAPPLGLEIVPTPIENAEEIEQSITAFSRSPNGGLLIVPDQTIFVHRDLVIKLTATRHLAAVYPLRSFVTAGGLMSYGVDVNNIFELAAAYVDRILRGEKPANLPVQAPTKYQTVINVKTAKTLGIEIPASLLVRADEVIE